MIAENLSLKPFSTFDNLFKAIYIISNYNSYSINILTALINKLTSDSAKENEIICLKEKINAFPELYGKSFFVNLTSFAAQIDSILNREPVIHFKCELLHCVFCDGRLNETITSSYQAMYYSYSYGPKKASINTQNCVACEAIHYVNYAELNHNRKMFPNHLNKKFVSFTHATIFDRQLLDTLTADIIFKHSSFLGFVNSYDYQFKNKINYLNSSEKIKRDCLYEKRLIENWFYYQYEKMVAEIKIPIISAPKMANLDASIRNLKPTFTKYFTSKWSGM